MKLISRFIIALGFIAVAYTAVYCQVSTYTPKSIKETKRFEVTATYDRTDFPVYNQKAEVENVNGFTIGVSARVFSFGKRGSVRSGYKLQRKLNQEVYPEYFDGKMMVDLYRDVNTHFVGGEIDYSIFFAGLAYGFRKLHEDTPYQLVRNIELGLKVPIGKGFFAKGSINYEQPYGMLPSGFVNPYNRSFSFGGGFKF